MRKKKVTQKIAGVSPELLEEVRQRLSESMRVRRTLPLDGRVHIDRTLPFLVVYRRPPKRLDAGTVNLARGEASYLIASGSRRFRASLSELIRTIVEIQSGKCGAFLLLEIWSGVMEEENGRDESDAPRASFRVVASPSRPPTKTIEALEDALRRMKINKRSAAVRVVYERNCSPEEFAPLLPEKKAAELNCFTIGLEVSPVYRDTEGGDEFPLLRRKLQLGLSRALKQAFFQFSHHQTDLRPGHYQALGRRAVVKAVWEVDRRLADISSAFDFLLLSTPINIDEAWLKFKKTKFEHRPVFYYRPRPVDPAVMKRRLYRIPIERVEDPTLDLLFREKRRELDSQLSMLEDRETKKFLYGSMQLFGEVSDSLLHSAEKVLSTLPPRSRENSREGHMNAESFAEQARGEIEIYRRVHPPMTARVYIRDDIVGLMVSRGDLFVSRSVKISRSRADALLQHEIGTHLVTYYNGKAQPFMQLYSGLAGYEELQEGLAVLSEYLVGGLSRPRLRLLAGRVVAVRCLTGGASFVDTFRELNRKYGFDQRTSFTVTARVYRSGGLTKDGVYLRGLVRLLKHVKDGGELEPLFVGKIAVNHIPIIKELQLRGVLEPAPIRPRFFEDPGAGARLKYLRTGPSILNLIEERKK